MSPVNGDLEYHENLLEEYFSVKAGDAPKRASGAAKRDGKKPLSLLPSLSVRRGWHCEKFMLSHWDVSITQDTCHYVETQRESKMPQNLSVGGSLVIIGHQVLMCAPGSCRKRSGPQLEETMMSLHHPNPSQPQKTHNKTHMSQKECTCFLLSAFDKGCMQKIPARESNTCLRICQKSGKEI